MRLATMKTASGSRAVRVEGDRGIVLDAADVGELLQAPDWRRAASASGPETGLDAEALLPVVPKPGNVLCVGLNFASHAEETGAKHPRYPSLFVKSWRSLIGARQPLALPHASMSTQGDWELELVLVVGRSGRNIPTAQARDHIAGYAVGNDGSVRDWQKRNRAPFSGKGWEGMTPLGPWLTTSDAVDVSDLEMVCEVDDTVMQKSRTSDMMLGPEAVLSYASSIVTLDPGDLIFLGTPGGTAMGRDPSPWLRPGQVLRSWIAELGELRNTCVEGPAPASSEWTAEAS